MIANGFGKGWARVGLWMRTAGLPGGIKIWRFSAGFYKFPWL
jgi:hypothetical protein